MHTYKHTSITRSFTCVATLLCIHTCILAYKHTHTSITCALTSAAILSTPAGAEADHAHAQQGTPILSRVLSLLFVLYFFLARPFSFPPRLSLSPSLAHNGTFCRGDLTCAFCSNSAANAQMRVALSRCRASKSAICCCNTESARCTSGTALLKVWRNSSCAFASCPWSPASARDVASTASSCELSSSRRAVSSRNRLDSALCEWYQKT